MMWEDFKELSHCYNTMTSTFISSCGQSIETKIRSRVDGACSLLLATTNMVSNSDLRHKK